MQLRWKLFIWALLSSALNCRPQPIVFRTTPPPAPSPYFEGLRECPQGSDKLLSECVKLVLDDIRSFAYGIPQIGLQSIEPLYLKELLVPITDEITYKWSNVVIHGLSHYSQNEVVVNTKEKTIQFWYSHPEILITADYGREGHFLWIPLRGTGKVQLAIFNLQFNGTIFLKVDEENGEPIIRIDNIVLEDGLEEIRSLVPDLFKFGVWGEFMDAFLNENAKWIYEEFIQERINKELVKGFHEEWKYALPKIFPATYFINTW